MATNNVITYGNAALFGVLVMAPFLTPGPRFVLRFAVLIVTPVLVTFTLTEITNGDGVIPQFLVIQPFANVDVNGMVYGIGGLVFDILEMALLLAVIPAFVLFIVAPLRVSWKYWVYTLSAGVLTAVSAIMWVYWFWCIWYCSWWNDLSIIFPYTVWALTFCVAVHCGRTNIRQISLLTGRSG